MKSIYKRKNMEFKAHASMHASVHGVKFDLGSDDGEESMDDTLTDADSELFRKSVESRAQEVRANG